MGKRLAIRGHSTRGKEVIKLLEIMGGSNIFQLDGEANAYSYYINGNGNAILHDRLSIAEDDDFEIFTLERFLEKFPFKIHDLVNIPEYESTVGICGMRWDSLSKCVEYMVYRNDDEEWYTAEELLKYNDNPNEPHKEKVNMKDKFKKDFCKRCGSQRCSGQDDDLKDCERFKTWSKEHKEPDEVIFISSIYLNSCEYADEVELNLGDYEIEVRDGKTYAVKKKSKYPTNYKECCDVLEIPNDERYIDVDVPLDYNKIVSAFTELLICRKAYWKIAGEEMGLDKPWEPKHCYGEEIFFIYCDRVNGINIGRGFPTDSFLLTFPTAEARDAFYENFKDLIEQCKELL